MSTPQQHRLVVAAMAVDNRRRRSNQKKIGPSSVGGCRRKAGYEVAGVPKTDSPPKMHAVLGTWIHKGALATLEREYGCLTEIKVENEVVKGSMDALYLDEAHLSRLRKRGRYAKAMDGLLVEDVKTRGYFGFQLVQENGPRRSELFQTHIYTWLLRIGAATDRRLAGIGEVPVEQIRLRYVSRDNGQEHIEEFPYDPDVTSEAIEWLAKVMDVALGPEGPDALPRDEDGPGLSFLCDGCVFLTRCWGPERPDGRMRQANLLHDDDEVALALVEYDALRKAASELKSARDLNRAKVDAAMEGQYGDWVIGWSQAQAKAKVDLAGLVDLVTEAGLEIPYTVPGPPTRRITVTKAKPSKVEVEGETPSRLRLIE